MTRIEERIEASIDYQMSTNPIAAFNAGAVWADKTMIDRAIEFFQSKSKHGMIEENINVFINEFCKVVEE